MQMFNVHYLVTHITTKTKSLEHKKAILNLWLLWTWQQLL